MAITGAAASILPPTGPSWGRPTVEAGKDEHEQLKSLAKEFEAYFLQEFLKQARASKLSDGLLDSAAEDNFRGMMDGEMARSVSRGVDLGIAEAMVEQLTFRRGKTGD